MKIQNKLTFIMLFYYLTLVISWSCKPPKSQITQVPTWTKIDEKQSGNNGGTQTSNNKNEETHISDERIPPDNHNGIPYNGENCCTDKCGPTINQIYKDHYCPNGLDLCDPWECESLHDSAPYDSGLPLHIGGDSQ